MNQGQDTKVEELSGKLQDLEGQIEHLTQETASLIRKADAAQQTELREYALNLLKEETETNEVGNAASASRQRPVPFNSLVLALPLVLIGGILWFAFPPMGNALFVGAALMEVWGILTFLLNRKK